MDISKIPAGVEPPHDINVFIEIPQGGLPVKYELDKASGVLFVNRFLHTTMFYRATTASSRTLSRTTATPAMRWWSRRRRLFQERWSAVGRSARC